MLKAIVDEELGYPKRSKEGYNSGNNGNGSFSKTIATENVGEVVLNIPSYRNAQFEPRIIGKDQTLRSKIKDAILGMYSRGRTTAALCNQVQAYTFFHFNAILKVSLKNGQLILLAN